MRYEFKVRTFQFHPSWIETWGDQVVDSSLVFEFFIGQSTVAALAWITKHSTYGGWCVKPTTPEKARQLKMMYLYAKALEPVVLVELTTADKMIYLSNLSGK